MNEIQTVVHNYLLKEFLPGEDPSELTSETPIRLTFLHRLREEIKFPTTEALKEQIGRDVKRAQRYFRLRNAFRIGA